MVRLLRQGESLPSGEYRILGGPAELRLAPRIQIDDQETVRIPVEPSAVVHLASPAPVAELGRRGVYHVRHLRVLGPAGRRVLDYQPQAGPDDGWQLGQLAPGRYRLLCWVDVGVEREERHRFGEHDFSLFEVDWIESGFPLWSLDLEVAGGDVRYLLAEDWTPRRFAGMEVPRPWAAPLEELAPLRFEKLRGPEAPGFRSGGRRATDGDLGIRLALYAPWEVLGREEAALIDPRATLAARHGRGALVAWALPTSEEEPAAVLDRLAAFRDPRCDRLELRATVRDGAAAWLARYRSAREDGPVQVLHLQRRQGRQQVWQGWLAGGEAEADLEELRKQMRHSGAFATFAEGLPRLARPTERSGAGYALTADRYQSSRSGFELGIPEGWRILTGRAAQGLRSLPDPLTGEFAAYHPATETLVFLRGRLTKPVDEAAPTASSRQGYLGWRLALGISSQLRAVFPRAHQPAALAALRELAAGFRELPPAPAGSDEPVDHHGVGPDWCLRGGEFLHFGDQLAWRLPRGMWRAAAWTDAAEARTRVQLRNARSGLRVVMDLEPAPAAELEATLRIAGRPAARDEVLADGAGGQPQVRWLLPLGPRQASWRILGPEAAWADHPGLEEEVLAGIRSLEGEAAEVSEEGLFLDRRFGFRIEDEEEKLRFRRRDPGRALYRHLSWTTSEGGPGALMVHGYHPDRRDLERIASKARAELAQEFRAYTIEEVGSFPLFDHEWTHYLARWRDNRLHLYQLVHGGRVFTLASTSPPQGLRFEVRCRDRVSGSFVRFCG